ncbi:hypothetical protein WI23_09955 [Burkholderia oklahomensis C6786]|nr:hypothetical protein WI23_09955 [Burkholderia oklahomensis C6786]KUY54813.1 hypothetical protein WI23_22265 [Burkholderia oklahomensis C6786]
MPGRITQSGSEIGGSGDWRFPFGRDERRLTATARRFQHDGFDRIADTPAVRAHVIGPVSESRPAVIFRSRSNQENA